MEVNFVKYLHRGVGKLLCIFNRKPLKLLSKLFPSLYNRLARQSTWSFMLPGDTVIQIGVDLHTKGNRSDAIKYSKIVGKTGKVVAIEPDKKNIRLLNEYVQTNRIENILIIEKAVWKEKGKLSFFLGRKSWWNRLELVPGNPTPHAFFGKCEVEADTLDNILEENGINDFSHVCMTINGAELEALEGMQKALQKEGLSLLIASGTRRQPNRPTVNGVPLNEKIVSILENYCFIVKIDEEGCVAAYKPY